VKKELEQKLIGRWPSWFNVSGDPRQTRMADGFVHGDGWFDIVWRLCEDLEPLVAEAERMTGRKFEVLQVKQKLGGLRFYVNQRIDEIQKRIEIAETESVRTCEACAQPGSRREMNWIRTLCDEHANTGGAENG
jgi:hypothetical protein